MASIDTQPNFQVPSNLPYLDQQSGEAEGTVKNPFARGGLARSTPRGAGVATSEKKAEGSTGGARSGAAPVEKARMTGVDFTRVLNRNRSGLLKMLVVAEQLDELIGYKSGWTTIIKAYSSCANRWLWSIRSMTS